MKRGTRWILRPYWHGEGDVPAEPNSVEMYRTNLCCGTKTTLNACSERRHGTTRQEPRTGRRERCAGCALRHWFPGQEEAAGDAQEHGKNCLIVSQSETRLWATFVTCRDHGIPRVARNTVAIQSPRHLLQFPNEDDWSLAACCRLLPLIANRTRRTRNGCDGRMPEASAA